MSIVSQHSHLKIPQRLKKENVFIFASDVETFSLHFTTTSETQQ